MADLRQQLLDELKQRAFHFGTFVLSSGVTRDYYIDCRLVTLSARGAWLTGNVVLDTRLGRVTLDGVPVRLTSHEFRVLSYLMHQRGRIVSQSELTEHIYAQNFDRDSNTVEVFIARLRRKLGPDVIETVRGLGYRMSAE